MDITFARNFQNIVCTMSLPNISLADHIKKISLTNATTKTSRKQTKALWKLEKHKVVEKRPKRNINCICNWEIKVLKNLLDMQMHEIKRLPALVFDNLPEEIGLETYEVQYNNPLHYIFHYTQNRYNELSKHLPKI